MKTYWMINGLNKHAEEDIFNEGCDGKGSCLDVSVTFKGDTLDELIEQVTEFLGIEDKQNVMIDSCDEKGRIDFQVYEDESGSVANEKDFEQWKAGRMRLWLCCYSARVSLITENDAPDLPANLSEISLYSTN